MNEKGQVRWEGPLLSGTDPAESGDPTTVRLRHADFPGWMVTIRFGPVGEVVGFSVDEYEWRADERRPLTASRLHALRAGEAISRARVIASATARARARRGENRSGAARLDGPQLDLAHFQALVHERPGRRGSDEVLLARIALEYERRVEAGDRAPNRGIAEAFLISESTAANKVLDARERGFLTKAPKQGKAGGRATAKARRILSEEGIA